MSEEFIDPDNLEKFHLPESVISLLFELSGSGKGDSGFILTYVNQEGIPAIITKVNSPIIELGLRQSLIQYLDQLAAQEIELNLPKDSGDEENP
jgi:hypothetical protein|tara:strand:- start:8814 stop:9095 length:282 start_codon:yes stop_codon:yes gene_type:complete